MTGDTNYNKGSAQGGAFLYLTAIQGSNPRVTKGHTRNQTFSTMTKTNDKLAYWPCRHCPQN